MWFQFAFPWLPYRVSASILSYYNKIPEAEYCVRKKKKRLLCLDVLEVEEHGAGIQYDPVAVSQHARKAEGEADTCKRK